MINLKTSVDLPFITLANRYVARVFNVPYFITINGFKKDYLFCFWKIQHTFMNKILKHIKAYSYRKEKYSFFKYLQFVLQR